MKRAILLVDHGSRRPEANALLEAVAELVAERVPDVIVRCAHMDLAEPDIAAGIAACAAAGADAIVVHPYFLGPGNHTTDDIPRLVRASRGSPSRCRHSRQPAPRSASEARRRGARSRRRIPRLGGAPRLGTPAESHLVRVVLRPGRARHLLPLLQPVPRRERRPQRHAARDRAGHPALGRDSGAAVLGTDRRPHRPAGPGVGRAVPGCRRLLHRPRRESTASRRSS